LNKLRLLISTFVCYFVVECGKSYSLSYVNPFSFEIIHKHIKFIHMSILTLILHFFLYVKITHGFIGYDNFNFSFPYYTNFTWNQISNIGIGLLVNHLIVLCFFRSCMDIAFQLGKHFYWNAEQTLLLFYLSYFRIYLLN